MTLSVLMPERFARRRVISRDDHRFVLFDCPGESVASGGSVSSVEKLSTAVT
jgi:hypothetical protein